MRTGEREAVDLLEERIRLQTLGKELEAEVVSLIDWQFRPQIVELIPRELAFQHQVIALDRTAHGLRVAMANPLDLYAREDIRIATGLKLEVALAAKAEVAHAIELQYSELEARRTVLREAEDEPEKPDLTELMAGGREKEQAPVVNLLNSLLITGYNTNVSDIHIEPGERGTKVRVRRDGMLLPYLDVPSSMHQGLVARIKILAHLDIAQRRKSQDGHFRIWVHGTPLHVRVSCMPVANGEKCVLRLLDSKVPIDRVAMFGMDQVSYGKLLHMLEAPSGLLYLTGPTGSGKTTTLYGMLEYLKHRPVNITTVEDPIERIVEGVSQTQVNTQAGITFESGLRALLRQDPDIIMVGETRDYETAGISARAAITGHLVLSTLHTRDALSSVVRLRDMGMADYLIAESLLGLTAQRLLRKTCVFCGGGGCHRCSGTGYRGRIAIHQVVEVDGTLRSMIADGRPVGEMKEYARRELGMAWLYEEAMRLADEGVTTKEEAVRVSGRDRG